MHLAGYNHQITDAGLSAFAGIHSLSIAGCISVTNAGLAPLAGIHFLDMSGCNGITDLSSLAGIHTLMACGCSGITMEGAGTPHQPSHPVFKREPHRK